MAGDIGPLPGGGLPTSTNQYVGNSGTLEDIQTGAREVQTIMFPDRSFSIQNLHGGTPSAYTLTTENLMDFSSSAAAFEIDFEESFDTGPNYGNDLVNFETPAVSVRFALSNASTPTEARVVLPRFLTTDKNWSATRIYFAGSGLPGSTGYRPGQRVISNNAAGVPTIYRVANGFGDGTTPSSLYDPNEGTPFYDNDDADELVYHDTIDILGIEPQHLIENAPYGIVPGDGGTGQAITASQARWEVVGPASTAQRTISGVVSEFRAALVSDPDFNQSFRVVEADLTDDRLIVEAAESSGENGFPTYDGLSLEFNFPDLDMDNMLETPADSNGGDFGETALTINAAASTVTTGGAVTFEALVTEREYVPFNSASPNTTGRYATDPSATVLDRVAITFNQSFSGPMINEDVAAVIRDGFRRDPTSFWTIPMMETGAAISLTSMNSGNYNLAVNVTAPADSPVSSNNFTVASTSVGTRSTIADNPASIPPEAPAFRITPPTGDTGERPLSYVIPTLLANTNDRGVLMEAVMRAALGSEVTYKNWEVVSRANEVVTIQTAADSSTDIPPPLRLAERPVNGQWIVEVVAPGNTVNTNLFSPTSLDAISIEMTPGTFALTTTPSYLGILVSNPAVPDSGLEFFVIDAGNPTQIDAAAAVNKWIPQIEQAIPRVALQRRGTGFFLQPANYDNLANFVLDVRLNDTPANAEWIYQIVTTGTNPENNTSGIRINTASDLPLVINGSELDHTFVAEAIPPETDPNYVRSGGPLKVGQYLVMDTSTHATLRIDPMTSGTTLIFDIFRPWPRNEINQNLEFPIFATVMLMQDDTGNFRNLNKITGADVGWSRPTYSFTPRTTTEDLTTFTETINMGDDFPVPYESYIERVQLAIQPEFDTEQLQSIALWADGETRLSLMGTPMHNQLDVRVKTTNNPGELIDLSVRPAANAPGAAANLFNISENYKIDMRQHGRFLNYRITDGEAVVQNASNTLSHQTEWRLSGMQADVMKGGTR